MLNMKTPTQKIAREFFVASFYITRKVQVPGASSIVPELVTPYIVGSSSFSSNVSSLPFK